jgi:DNA-binding NarL/FixJ family response regulator
MSKTGTIPKKRAHVLLADDSPATLEQVCQVLGDKYEVVAAVTSGTAVLAHAETSKPDVIVIDIALRDLSGIEVARRLRTAHSARIVFLTIHEDRAFVTAAFGAGASGYVVKSKLASDLCDAIDAALSGRIFVSADLGVQIGRSEF